MGAGKLPVPGEGRGQQQVVRSPFLEKEEEDNDDPPLTVAELVCELLYAGKTRADIAGYDDVLMRWILCRPRDECGALIRVDRDLPRWVAKHLDSKGHWVINNPQSYSGMFRQVMRQQGLSEEEQQQAWNRWKAENPNYGMGGE